MALTLQEARTIIEAGLARARELNQRVVIAVVDEAGHLVSLDRMDGAPLHRDRFALGKAFGAVLLRQPTAEASKLRETAPDRYFGILSMFPEQIYLLSGGVPLEADGRIVGAVGVAGGAAGMDEPIAEAGIAAWRRQRG
jgi:uncharacterized protein GlcG (DUF336 family)